jgi:hypothetical protein
MQNDIRQPGDLGVRRGVVPRLLGGSEDPWLSVSAFRRIGPSRCYALSIVEVRTARREVNIIGIYANDTNVRFGSVAASQHDISERLLSGVKRTFMPVPPS